MLNRGVIAKVVELLSKKNKSQPTKSKPKPKTKKKKKDTLNKIPSDLL